jgi:hypothetical protein
MPTCHAFSMNDGRCATSFFAVTVIGIGNGAFFVGIGNQILNGISLISLSFSHLFYPFCATSAT